METDPKWKRGERLAVVVIGPLCGILGVLCAALGAYFAAGTYFGWDKQAMPPVTKDHAGGTIMTLPPWLGLALLGVAIVSLLTSWGMILIRRRAKHGPDQKFTARAGMISLNEIEFNTSRLNQAAPWLEIYLTFFNDAGHLTRPYEATGRVIVSGQEFHGQIELIDLLKSHPDGQFFRTGLKIPVSASEAKHCLDSILFDNLSLDFSRATMTFGVIIYNVPGPSPVLNVWLPMRVSFNTKSLRTDPYLPWQSMPR
jgi:hypothetical protein